MRSGELPTYAARLTPAGSGAIATVAVRGPRALEIARTVFLPPPSRANVLASESKAGHFWFGHIGEQAPGSMNDQVVLALKSIEPMPLLEVHCHGGEQVVGWLLEMLEKQGARNCSWEEMEQPTDSMRMFALKALSLAPTARTASILLDQVNGALSDALQSAFKGLETNQLDDVIRTLEQVIRYMPVARHLVEPWRVAVLGAPNVGKSSLVNALAGFQRCIVSSTPGTTRDVVTTRIAIDGWPIELADTAGVRQAKEELEKAGVERAHKAAETADLCLWVMDLSENPVWPPPHLRLARLVINKTDLPAKWGPPVGVDAVPVSAQTGAGLDELCEALSHWLVPDPPRAGGALPFPQTICNQITEVLNWCRTGQKERAQAALLTILPEKQPRTEHNNY